MTSSSAEDQLQDQGQHRRRSSRINHIDGEDQRNDFRPQRISSRIKDIEGGGAAGSSSAEDQLQDQGHRRRRSSRIFVRRGSAAGSRTSSEKQQDQPHNRQRISSGIKDIIVVGASRINHIIVRESAAGSRTSSS